MDPLADPKKCRRDVPYLVRLRTNVIRTYAIDPTANHDECMRLLADAGIYVVSDLSEPRTSINRDDAQWNGALYQRYISVIDSLSKYGNVLGFFAGNEVSNSGNTTAASAFVKAAVRDSKAYIKQQGYGSLGVGYATYDGEIRTQLAQYFNCGPEDESIDFWGYNVYSWCGDSNFKDSGYEERTRFFKDYSVPIFFAEYGCNKVEPREFSDVPALYGSRMTDTWSGGIVYMYFQEDNEYGKLQLFRVSHIRTKLTQIATGLVDVDDDSVSPREDFSKLSSRMATISPSSTNRDDYSPTFSPTTCPEVVTSTGSAATDQLWLAEASPLPPTPNQALCACKVASLSCVSDSNDPETYLDDFGFICGVRGKDYCAGIEHNATTGSYGAFGQCNPKQQLSFVMDRYYQDQPEGAKASACAFGGRARTQQPARPSGNCGSLLRAARDDGSGNVPQPSGNSQQQGGSSGGNGGNGGSTSNPAAHVVGIPSFDWGVVQMGLYVLVAVGTGMGMILL